MKKRTRPKVIKKLQAIGLDYSYVLNEKYRDMMSDIKEYFKHDKKRKVKDKT